MIFSGGGMCLFMFISTMLSLGSKVMSFCRNIMRYMSFPIPGTLLIRAIGNRKGKSFSRSVTNRFLGGLFSVIGYLPYCRVKSGVF